MNERMYEALEVCLQALETGAETESVLKLFPEMKDDLFPILETSRQAIALAVQEVPEAVLRRSKARVLQHAAGMRESVAKRQKQTAKFAFPRLAVSLAIALLFLLSGTGLVRASDGALPGDHLYPVKRTWEDVRLLLVFSPESREELEIEFEQERLHEIDELLVEGRHETITFAGVVTEQNGDLWVVSGVPVQITSESRLPATPVSVGTSVMLQGRTNPRGFVEAKFIEVLGSNIVLPTSVPTAIEMDEDNFILDNSSPDENDNGHEEDEAEPESPSDEDHDNGGSEDNHDDSDEDSKSNSGKNENDSDVDQSNDNSHNDDQSKDDESDNSGPEGGHDENDDEDYD